VTIWTDEISIQDSQPVELIDRACGLEHWRHCSGPLPIVYDSETYQPLAGLNVGEIQETGNYLRDQLEIETTWADPFVKRYPARPPDAITTINVYRLQGAENLEWWTGYVKMVRRRADRKAVITCTTSLNELGLGTLCLRAGRQCQVPVYSTLCGLTQTDWEVNGQVDSFDGKEITSTTFALEADGWWTGGPITVNGYRFMIVTHAGDTVELTAPVPDLLVGMPFAVAPGCNHLMAICESRFDNLANYKGFPNLPSKDPFSAGML
jgi:uncharacterized phage protein (TIGR02218 family)